MIKKFLALCDGEESYLRHMADYMEKKGGHPFAIRAFTNKEQLKKFTEKNDTEFLLIAENAYEEKLQDLPIAHIMVLNESGNQVGGDMKNINKYQSSEVIFRTVMENYMEGVKEISPRIAVGNRMKIIGCYSPVGRCLQTTFALSMGQLLARKHKTLYLNFENYSGFGQLLPGEFTMDIMDVLYYFDCEKDKLSYRLGGMMQSLNGLDYIPPAFFYKDLEEIDSSHWMGLFKEIEMTANYEYLILDLSAQVRGLLDILRECFRVFTIMKEDMFAKAKMRQYESILQSMNYGDVALKTKKWVLPEFYKLPSKLDQLTNGELAAYIKKIIEEEVYGYGG